MSRGLFIVLEGIDGSGLSTQSLCLCDTLIEQGHRSILTKEPTTGPVGALLRQALGNRLHLAENSISLLFAADRFEHLNETVIPHLEQGTHVICDRYYLSSLAYQSLKVDEDWLWLINAFALVPDVLIFIDLGVCEAVKRIEKRGQQREVYEETRALTAIRRNFLRLLDEKERVGHEIITVDGDASIAHVRAEVARHLLPLTGRKRPPLRTLEGDIHG